MSLHDDEHAGEAEPHEHAEILLVEQRDREVVLEPERPERAATVTAMSTTRSMTRAAPSRLRNFGRTSVIGTAAPAPGVGYGFTASSFCWTWSIPGFQTLRSL